MRDFFKGWRRKTGCGLLVMATAVLSLNCSAQEQRDDPLAKELTSIAGELSEQLHDSGFHVGRIENALRCYFRSDEEVDSDQFCDALKIILEQRLVKEFEVTDSFLMALTGSERARKLLGGSRYIESLSFNYCKLTNDDFASLELPSFILRLSLAGARITDVSIPKILSLAKLEELHLGERVIPNGRNPFQIPASEVTATGIRMLGTHASLKKLSLRALPVTSETMDALVATSKIRELDLSATPVSDRDIVRLLATVPMKRLVLRDVLGSRPGHEQPGISARTLTSSAVSPGCVLKCIEKYPGCETVYFHDETLARWRETKLPLRDFLKNEKLLSTDREGRVRIDLSKVERTTDELLMELARIGEVDEVFLRCSAVSKAGLHSLSSLKKLQQLILDVNGMESREIEGLEFTGNLSICGASVNDAWIPSLTQISEVKSLTLYRTEVSEKGLLELRMHFPVVRRTPESKR